VNRWVLGDAACRQETGLTTVAAICYNVSQAAVLSPSQGFSLSWGRGAAPSRPYPVFGFALSLSYPPNKNNHRSARTSAVNTPVAVSVT